MMWFATWFSRNVLSPMRAGLRSSAFVRDLKMRVSEAGLEWTLDATNDTCAVCDTHRIVVRTEMAYATFCGCYLNDNDPSPASALVFCDLELREKALLDPLEATSKQLRTRQQIRARLESRGDSERLSHLRREIAQLEKLRKHHDDVQESRRMRFF